MKKALKAIIVALLFSNFIYAKTIQVASPGNDKDIQPAVQTAVNGAVNGDIIVLPAGQFIVNKSIVITKFISDIEDQVRKAKVNGKHTCIIDRIEAATTGFFCRTSG